MSFLRGIITVGSGTALSRLMGFARDVLLANLLGAGPVADAFVVAFRLPNLFRRLLSEGAFNASFVPVFARLRQDQGEAAAQGFAGQVLQLTGAIGLGLTLLAELFMPQLVYALAPGFFHSADQAALTVLLSRLTFPFLAFCLLTSIFAALLNARESFGLAAFAPVVLNGVLILCLLAAAHYGAPERSAVAMLVAGGVSLAGLAQTLWCLFGTGARQFIWQWPRLNGPMRRMLLLSGPGLIAGGIGQINGFIGALVGSGAPSVVSHLYYADRVYQLPLGLIGTALGLVVLPKLARALGAGQSEEAQRLQGAAVEVALFLTLPAALALGQLAEPITRLLFEHGAFDAEARRGTALALQAFALGLPALSLAKALHPSFFARQSMRAPLLIALIGAGLDLALSLALFGSLKAQGIALAAAAAAWFNAGAVLLVLLRAGLWHIPPELPGRCVRLLISALIMAGAIAVVQPLIAPLLATNGLIGLLTLAALVTLSVLLYGGAALGLGALDWRGWRQIG